MAKIKIVGSTIATPDKRVGDLLKRVKALEENPGGGSIAVDSKLDATSTNPVQNRVVTEKFAELHGTVGNIDALLKTI